MDVDVCGPSVPKITGVEGEEIHQSNLGIYFFNSFRYIIK